MKIRAFQPTDEATVVALWQECGLTRPWNDPHADIARKLTEQPDLFLVLTQRGCPKLNLLVRSSNAEVIEFYRRLGYVQDETVSLGKRLIRDEEKRA